MRETAQSKSPVAAATTSLTTLVMVSMLMMPAQTTSATSQEALTKPDALIWYANEGIDYSTSSSMTMTYEQIEKPFDIAKFAAFEMFGKMRGSTQEEKNLYEDMLARISRPIDVDIFAL